jgi:SAM-dependent methyltransferase
MAHEAQNKFFRKVKEAYPDNFVWKNVLEVGSLDINGSVRDMFSSCNYVGVDIGNGPGVDLVCSGHELAFPDNSFDTVVSAECFEHNPFWRETFVNMSRMLKSDGLFAFTCAGEGRPEHGTTRSDVGSSPLTVAAGWDYYRNLVPNDFTHDDLQGLSCRFWQNNDDFDLYFLGIKDGGAILTDIGDYPWR